MFEKLLGRTPQLMNEENYKKYAVVVPYLPQNKTLLFEVRADTLKRQPGEVSLPGGRVEKGETTANAAVRETMEELCLPQKNIELLAPLDILPHLTSSLIYPFLANIHHYHGSFSPDEVKEVFEVPLAYFLNTPPQVYHNKISVTSVDENFPYALLGVPSYPWASCKNKVLFYQYQGRTIWGITAHIVKNFVDLLQNKK